MEERRERWVGERGPSVGGDVERVVEEEEGRVGVERTAAVDGWRSVGFQVGGKVRGRGGRKEGGDVGLFVWGGKIRVEEGERRVGLDGCFGGRVGSEFGSDPVPGSSFGWSRGSEDEFSVASSGGPGLAIEFFDEGEREGEVSREEGEEGLARVSSGIPEASNNIRTSQLDEERMKPAVVGLTNRRS